MVGHVKYPFHVRHNGVSYAPGEVFEVEDVTGHKLRGAIVVEVEPVVEKQRTKSRRKAEKASENEK